MISHCPYDFFKVYFYFKSVMRVFVAYVCTMCALDTFGGQKRALDPLKLEFQTAAKWMLGKSPDLYKNSECP